MKNCSPTFISAECILSSSIPTDQAGIYVQTDILPATIATAAATATTVR